MESVVHNSMRACLTLSRQDIFLVEVDIINQYYQLTLTRTDVISNMQTPHGRLVRAVEMVDQCDQSSMANIEIKKQGYELAKPSKFRISSICLKEGAEMKRTEAVYALWDRGSSRN